MGLTREKVPPCDDLDLYAYNTYICGRRPGLEYYISGMYGAVDKVRHIVEGLGRGDGGNMAGRKGDGRGEAPTGGLKALQ